MIYVKAFVVGGLICTLVQLFLDHTKLMPGRVMVLGHQRRNSGIFGHL